MMMSQIPWTHHVSLTGVIRTLCPDMAVFFSAAKFELARHKISEFDAEIDEK